MNQNLSCLLVSPQPGDRVLVEEALGQGFNHLRIKQATDGLSWQEALGAGEFNLGIIAEALPWAETSAVVRSLKSRHPECPVIMLAVPEREEAAWEALRSGADDYVLTSPEEMRRLPVVVQAARYRVGRLAGEPSGTGEADFRALFDAAPEVILVHDPETGRILDANQEACRVLGYTREEFSNLPLGTISLGQPPFTQEEGLKIIRKAVQEGPQAVEWLGRDRNRKPIWAKVSLKCLLIGGSKRVLSFARNISAVKQAQEASQEAESRYETLLDSAGDAIFIHDTAGRLLQVNDAACKLLGYARAELQQMTLKDIEPPDHPLLPKKIRDSRVRGHVFVETALRRRDGAAVPVELSSRFVEYAGVPVAFSIARDMTERKEAEEKLRQSEILYRSIFETTATATCISGEDTILRLVNAECTKLSGYTREELEGKKSWTEFIVPEDLERLKEYHRLRRLDPEAAPKSYTLRWQDRQGRIRDILATMALIPGTKNSVASLLDITAQQQAEKALRESEERYRLLVETMNDGLGMQDENGVITFINQRFCEMLGYSREELLKRPLHDFLDPANQEILEEQRKRRQRGERQTYELTWTRKDGTTVTTSMSPVPMFDPSGKFQGSFAVIADLTARQEAGRALRESEEKYRAIFENSGTAMAIVNEDNTISLVNAEFEKLSGYSREEVEGKKSWMEFAALADQAMVKEYHRLRRLDPPQAPRNYEGRFIDRHGGVKDMLVTAGMIPGTNKSVGSLLDFTAHKKAEQELDYERKKFQILTENSPFAMVMIGKEGEFKYVNPKFIELFGYGLEDVPDGKTWFRKAFPDPAYRHQVISAWVNDLERAKPGEKRPRTWMVTCKDGAAKIISFIPLQLDDGDNLMACEDITEQHRAAEAIKRSEHRFRLLMENSMSHLAIIDANGAILYETPTIERTLGYDVGELDGKTTFEFIHPEDQARSREILMQLLESPGRIFPTVLRYRHKDGSWRFLEIKAKNLLDEPIIRGIVVNAHDITQRTKALEALRQSEERYRAIVEDQTELVTRFLPDGTVTFANETLCRYFGKTREEMIGHTFCRFIPKGGRGAVQKNLSALSQETPFATIEHRVFMPDGQVAWHQWTHRAIFDDQGLIIEFQGVGRDITERKRAEEALRESEELHSRILDTMPDLVYELSLDGNLIYANRATAEILGYAPAELLRLKLEDLLDAEGLEHANRVVQEMVASRQPSSTESYQLRTAQGRFIPIETRAILVERSNQSPTIVGVSRDITQRQQAEQALRQAEAEKSLILENMSEMVTYRDRENRILWANPAAAAYIGLTPEEIVGHFCYEIYYQRQAPCPDCVAIKAMETGRPMETEALKAKGRTLSLRSSPVKDEKGEIQGTVLVSRDITARKKAEEGLKASEEKMRLVIESSPVGIRITLQSRHIYVNPALVQMCGYADAGEIVDRPVDLLFAREEGKFPQIEMTAGPAGKPATSSYEARGLKKDGTKLEVQVWQTEIDYHGEPAILDFVLDLSEAKTLRSQLLQAQKMDAIGTLAGGIAHDFNNILFPILVNTEMMLETMGPVSPLRPRMERVFKACERAIDLVKQILAFSRQEERELSPVRLTPIIDDSLRLLRASLPTTIEMRRHLDSAADTVLADPTQIQQVLINLYTNAAHALRERGGVIDISLHEVDGDKDRSDLPPNLGPGPYLQVTVKDNGHGMDAATKERILDPYFTTKKPGEGTGLGLAVVHGIVKRHKGAITVESEPGMGSSFHIFLPRVEGEALKETMAPLPLPQGRERILLVDDETEIVATLQQMLESLGYRVAALTGSAAALDTFRAKPEDFDLVITDQTMPQLTGEELAREMLRLRPNLPIILCTGFSEAVFPEKARTMGIREFIIKPISTRMMAETIRRALAPKQDLS